jgi:hypothetical protein
LEKKGDEVSDIKKEKLLEIAKAQAVIFIGFLFLPFAVIAVGFGFLFKCFEWFVMVGISVINKINPDEVDTKPSAKGHVCECGEYIACKK